VACGFSCGLWIGRKLRMTDSAAKSLGIPADYFPHENPHEKQEFLVVSSLVQEPKLYRYKITS